MDPIRTTFNSEGISSFILIDITMKLFLAALVLASVVLAAFGSPADEDHAKWQAFKAAHGKSYGNASEEARRKALFLQTEAKIKAHNSNADRTYSLGHNHFSDMTEEEKEKHRGLAVPAAVRSEETVPSDVSVISSADERAITYDYRKDVCMTPIKNQGQCGSCWAFSAIAPLEFSYCTTHGNVAVNLSEQQLVDCDTANSGCNGGWPTTAWNYIKSVGGSEVTSAYPYVSGTTKVRGTCAFNSNYIKAKVASYASLPTTKTGVITALSNKQLVFVAMDASNISYYSSGVFNGPCTTSVNHGVVVVGYDATLDAWIVRNSWGQYWGQAGYIYIKAGVNMCGIEKYPMTVTAAL